MDKGGEWLAETWVAHDGDIFSVIIEALESIDEFLEDLISDG